MNNPIKKILIVEDGPGDIRLMQMMFARTNTRDFELHWVDRLSSALEVFADPDVNFDLVLLDLFLPDSYGLETIQQVCAVAPQVPIVVLTGLEDEEMALSALQKGAQDYLIKGSVNGQLLIRAIRNAIERKQIELILRRREAILEAVGFAADKFLRTSNIEQSMTEFLTRLGEATEISCIHVFQVNPASVRVGGKGEDAPSPENPAPEYSDAVYANLRYEWTSPGIQPQIHNPLFQNINMEESGLSRWVKYFKQGEIIQGPIRDFPAAEKKILTGEGVTSTLAVPIFVEKVTWGYIRFDEYSVEREWSQSEIEALKIAAGILGAAILNRQNEERLEYIATHDMLTNLPNRKLFIDRLQHALFRSQRNGRIVAVMLLDLDKFKFINDTLGHDKGDELLIEVATRLNSRVRRSDTVARLGGDEFVIILEDISQVGDGATIAHQILESLAKPCHLDGSQINAHASIGISVYPQDGQDGDSLLKAADIAMYRAKETRNSFRYFSLNTI